MIQEATVQKGWIVTQSWVNWDCLSGGTVVYSDAGEEDERWQGKEAEEEEEWGELGIGVWRAGGNWEGENTDEGIMFSVFPCQHFVFGHLPLIPALRWRLCFSLHPRWTHAPNVPARFAKIRSSSFTCTYTRVHNLCSKRYGFELYVENYSFRFLMFYNCHF